MNFNNNNSKPRRAVKVVGSQEEEREKVIQEMNASKPLIVRNWDVLEKTESEWKAAKICVTQHKKELVKAGFNPKKRMNLSASTQKIVLH